MHKLRYILLLAALLTASSATFAQHRSTQNPTHPNKTNFCKVFEPVPGLIVYQPAGIPRLAFGTMPKGDTSINICCEAAYTNKIMRSFTHSNVCGDHVLDKVRYSGARCPANTGAFVYYDGRYQFRYGEYTSELDSAAKYRDGIGFGQSMVLWNYQLVKQTRTLSTSAKEYYRCLCEKDSMLFICDSKESVSFGRFIYMLIQFGAKNAVYMDMGGGWNHSYYKNAEGRHVNIHPKGHDHCTNWLYFTTEPLAPLADSVVVQNRVEEQVEEQLDPQTVKKSKASESNGTKFHTVRSGDTLGKIASKYHTTTSKIIKLNPKLKSNPDKLSLGQRIRVK